jgi:ATP-dependent DNA helicase RecG
LLEVVVAGNGVSTKQAAEAVGLSRRFARSRLKALVQKGLIVEVGSGPNDPKRVYLPLRTAVRTKDK